MASFSTLKESSSTSNRHTYHVFLSFRGKDTRNTFTDHLYANLVAHGIHTFRDDEELEKGGDIASDLSRAIQESKIFIIIFSENYADSKWCLNELVKIIDCMTKKGSTVLPVFYHVDPRDVGNQEGSFKDAFLDHAKDADEEKGEIIKTWKIALSKAAKLSGYPVDNQSEAEFIQRIREVIITRLNHKPLHVGNNIVGMDFHLEQLKSLIKTKLDEVHMVGIYGIRGIGKTTISKAIYNDISSQFDGSSFLENVGRKCEDDLLELQRTLLQDILKGKRPEFNNISEGINVIKDRLQSKRVLIVLDDVDKYTQLENLAGKYGWYGAKSIIIITTKDKHLLELHEVNAVYEVQKLNHEKSTELFNWWAFKQNTPTPKFESLSNSVVMYADGLPIALRVLGGLLFNKSMDEWKSELHKLRKIPDKIVQSVLKVSYDKLDRTEQGIFLDIACVFRGKDKDFVSRILGSYAEIGIKVLNDRCLITISENKLDMHDLLQQMAQEIICQECPQEPGKRSRLWDPIDVNSVLTRNTGTQAIEGLLVEIPGSNWEKISTNSFTKMDRLRLLKVYVSCPAVYEAVGLPNLFEPVGLPMVLEFPSFDLRYLHFESYPLQSLPTNFHGKNLVELDLIRTNIKQLWNEYEILDNLKVINLSYSKYLIEIPDFSSVPNLEILILRGCTSLESLARNFHKLKHLEKLYCEGCIKLKSFLKIKGNMSKLRKIDLSRTAIIEVPSSIENLNGLEHFKLISNQNLVILPESICNLSSLETLIVRGCSNLKGFPEMEDDMENLERLDLSFTAIEELPSSIGHLKALKHLDLSSCEDLVNLPESICTLSSLESLIVEGCSNLKGFPEMKDDMENLEELDLSFTAIEELPSSIGHLKALKHLDLSSCKDLVNLPESICTLSSLESLIVNQCSNLKGFPEMKDDMENLEELDLSFTAIEELPSSIGRLKALKHLDLSSCKDLVNLPESICTLSSLESLIVEGCSNLKGFPEMKDDMENLEELDLSFTAIEELPSSIGHLKALKYLNLSNCKNLVNLLESICNLSSLETLIVRGCSNLKGFPEMKDDMENLERLDLSFTAIEELPSSIRHLKALKHLDLSSCEDLVNLPENICNLSSLETLKVLDCPKLERLEVNLVGSLDATCCVLKQGVIWGNNRFSSLQTLNLQCNQMEGEILNHHISPLSSLIELSIRNSKQIMYREILHDIFHLSSLEVLSVGNPMVEGVIRDIFHQSSLKRLSLRNCNYNLMKKGIPTDFWNLSSLVILSLDNCNLMEGEILNHICHLSSLEELSLYRNHFNSIPAVLSRLSILRVLDLSHCKKLQEIGELPSSLRGLNLSHCKKLQEIPELPSSLRGLNLSHCKKLQEIPELPSSLRGLNLSHCKKLQEIPELPSGLRLLDAHFSDGISSSPSFSSIQSLGNHFKSKLIQEPRISVGACIFGGKGTSIVIPKSSGILEGIRNQSMESCGVTIELPQNWNENKNFLGFALCCVFYPLDEEFDNGYASESKNKASLEFCCWLIIKGNNESAYMDCLSFGSRCDCYDDDNGRESDHVWFIYYPKDASKEKYRSNQWTHLTASFSGGRTFKAKECGIHLIYASCFKCQQNEECQRKL